MAVVTLGARAPTQGAAAASELVTLTGVVRTLVADGVGHGDHPVGHKVRHVARKVLVVGSRSYFLSGADVPANRNVRVTGEVHGRHLKVVRAEPTDSLPSDVLVPTGTTRVLVLLAYWTAPDLVTREQAAEQMFGDTNAWYRDASFGQLGQTGDVTPWMRISGPKDGKCYADSANTMTQAKEAAQFRGFDVASYDNFVLYHPNANGEPGSDCGGFAGWAYIGAANTWLNGFMDRRATVHEQGHNYGLRHSHSNLCTQVISGTCTFDEYGDVFDAMGSSNYVGHFSASQKDRLGWLNGRLVDLTAGGQAALTPMASDSSAPHAIRIQTSTSRVYWIEYRQAIDFDANLPTSGLDGVQIRVSGDDRASPDSGASLLDLRPGDGLSPFTATLRAGGVWRSPEGITIRVGTASATSAQVTVQLGPTQPDRQAPAVASAPTQSLVVWQESAGGDSDIAAARVDPSGVVIDPNPIRISTASGDQTQPTVAWNGSTFLVAWTDSRSGSSRDVYGTQVRADGSVVFPGGRAISTAAGDQTYPAASANGSMWLVVWQDGRSGTGADIYGTRVKAGGTVLNPAGVVVSRVARDQRRPAVAAGEAGWLVTWADRRNATAVDGSDVYGTRVGLNGSALSPTGTAISKADRDQSAPSVAWNGTSYLAAWTDYRSSTSLDVYGARVSANGVVQDPTGIAVSARPRMQGAPTVTSIGDQFMVLWDDHRAATGLDVYCSLVAPTGAVASPLGAPVVTAPRNQSLADAGAAGGRIFAAWGDFRSGTTWDIYGTHIDVDGNVQPPGGFGFAG